MSTVRPSLRLACAVGAALLAAGCAGNDTSSAGGASSTGDIVIGTSISLSGNTVLASIRDGYQLAVDQANTGGGVTVGGVTEVGEAVGVLTATLV
jgi:hypothetical protein